jgi:predicted secreted protein
MAVITGKDGSVAVGSAGSEVNVSQVTSWSISIEADTLEFTNFDSAGWKENKGSLKSWSGSLEGFADTAQTATLDLGSTVSVVLVEGGSGSKTYTGEAVITSKNVSSSTAELVTLSIDITGTGELVETTTS